MRHPVERLRDSPPLHSGHAMGMGANAKRVTAILEGLDEAYPEATGALVHENAFQLLVATILSAQCTDIRVNMVTPTLFGKYPTPAAFMRARHLCLSARPPSMPASLDPVVEQPGVLAAVGEFHRSARI